MTVDLLPRSLLTKSAALHDPAFASTESLDGEQRSLIATFNAELATGHRDLESVPCLCGDDEASLIATYDRYRIRQDTVLCRGCGLIRSDPRLTDKEYREFYASDLYRQVYNPAVLALDRSAFDEIAARRRYRFDFVSRHLDAATTLRVIEVGCGGGWNLWPYHQAGCTTVGYDPGARVVAFGRSLGLDLRNGFFEDVEAGEFDLVILSHVIEHLSDPVSAIATLATQVGSSAAFYIEVPDADHFAVGGLQNAHTFWFTPRSLRHYLAQAGLVTVAIESFGSHVGGLFHAGRASVVPLDGEYDRMSRLIRAYDRRERLKRIVGQLGLLNIAKGIVRRIRRP